MSRRQVFLLGGSMNPPGLHHLTLAHRITHLLDHTRDDHIEVLPCGRRSDKPSTNQVDPRHRGVMTQLTFAGIEGVTVELIDLDGPFTRTWDLNARYQAIHPDADIWHVIGMDLIAGARHGESQMQRTWFRGEEVFQTLHFIVLTRDGVHPHPEDLPPNSSVLEGATGSSSRIRAAVQAGEPIDHLVHPDVAAYIVRHGLYL